MFVATPASPPSHAPIPASGDLSQLKARLFKARSELVEQQPFLGSLVLMLPVTIIEDPQVSTAAVDGSGRCYFGRAFLEQLKVEELRAILLHETLHLALDVFARRGTRKRLRWNVAHDFVINQLIEDSDPGHVLMIWPKTFPPLLDPAYKGKSAEEIYDELPADLSKLGLSPADILYDLWEDLTPQEREELRRVWREKLVSAAEQALASGYGIDSLPGWAQKLLGPILNPKIPWQTELAHRVHGKLGGRRRTFARPGRRSHALGVSMPGPVRDRGAVGVFVDVSGSVGEAELGAFMGELSGILRDAELLVRLITWDVTVQEDLWLENADGLHQALADRELCLQGGGGTDPRCVIDYLDEVGTGDHPRPSFAILLTDGEVPWPDADQWPMDLLVVSTGPCPPDSLGYESIQLGLGADV